MFWKNAGEWTGSVEIIKEEILAVSVACMAIYLLQALKGERLSSVFSPDWTLISANNQPSQNSQ